MAESLADILGAYMKSGGYGPDQLSKASGVSRSTIYNWRDGIVKKPRSWHDLVRIARTLGLKEEDATRLLHAAHQPSIANLLASDLTDQDRSLLEEWAQERVQHQRAIGVFDTATLIAAQQLLATLPLTVDASPAPFPRQSRMHLSSNPLFVGRRDSLRRIAVMLKAGGTIVISGLGGIGKTQLAVEVVHRYGQYYAGGVFWLSFANPTAVPTEIAACGGAAHLDLRPDYYNLPLSDQVQLVIKTWQSPLPHLLIFDSCDDEALLAMWRPSTGACRILVTSRQAHWNQTLGIQIVPLDVLSRTESVALLHRYRPDMLPNDATLYAIADVLGDLPLALHLAGSFLATYQHELFGAPTYYLEQLHRDDLLTHPSLQGEGVKFSPTAHELNVERTFALSYERLDSAQPIDAYAIALLSRLTYFAPGVPIPRDLLRQTIAQTDSSEVAFQVAKALGRLIELGLVTEETNGMIRIHPLLAKFVRGVSTDIAAQRDVERALIATVDQEELIDNPAPLLPLQVHFRTVTEAAQQREDEQAAQLCSILGNHLAVIGDHAAARNYLERALAIHKAVLGEDHLDTARSLSYLGNLLEDQGEYATAVDLHRHALKIREAVLGEDHLDIARSLNNLGNLLADQGEYATAHELHSRALRIRRTILGENHTDTARSLTNIGNVLCDAGDFEAARPPLERALHIFEHNLGEQHLVTANCLAVLGRVLHAQKQYTEARLLYERALAIRKALLNADNITIGWSYNHLGELLKDQQDFEEARQYYEQALAIWEPALGSDHTLTAVVLQNLSEVYMGKQDYAQAQSYGERAWHIFDQQLGSSHLYTATALLNLGELWYKQGDEVRARHYFTEASAILESKYSDHPTTALCRISLARLSPS